MSTIEQALALPNGWALVYLERRLGRPAAARWYSSAVRYGQPGPRRLFAHGPTPDAAVSALADKAREAAPWA